LDCFGYGKICCCASSCLLFVVCCLLFGVINYVSLKDAAIH
jgi:hypothetical protein